MLVFRARPLRRGMQFIGVDVLESHGLYGREYMVSMLVSAVINMVSPFYFSWHGPHGLAMLSTLATYLSDLRPHRTSVLNPCHVT